MRRLLLATVVLGLTTLMVIQTGFYLVPVRAEPGGITVGNKWLPMSMVGAPAGRGDHTAVWTGAEMIVWGGRGYPDNSGRDTLLGGGGRYDPANDTWTTVQIAGAPSARSRHLAVWTGQEMLVWGGVSTGAIGNGGRYNPLSDDWHPIAPEGAPSPRYRATAVWTGTAMIVWGGTDGTSYFGDGARYTPATDSWSAVSMTGAPSPRAQHNAVWTGSEMIVWGGRGTTSSGHNGNSDGAAYNPATDSWRQITSIGAPALYFDSMGIQPTAVWTGTELVVLGVNTSADDSEGGVYNPATDKWRSTGPGDFAGFQTAVWTGWELIQWDGSFYPSWSGSRYNPRTNTWTRLPAEDAPPSVLRGFHTAVWTGKEMIVWGGIEGGMFPPLQDGGRYVPPPVYPLYLPLVGISVP